MTDETIIAKHNLIQDRTYDRLAAWGRRWLPLATVFFITLSGVFVDLSKVHGLEGAAPWMVAVGGILAAVSAGINEFLKRAKELWMNVESAERIEFVELHPELSHISESGIDLDDPANLESYYFMNQAERLKFVELHPELFTDKKDVK